MATTADLSQRRLPSRFWLAFVRSRVVRRLFVRLMKVAFGLHIRNEGLVSPPGPYIFASNHASHYDLFLAMASFCEITGELPVPVVWRGVFDLPVIGSILRALEAVSVSHDRGDEAERAAAVQEMIGLVRAGHCLVMACEGKRLDALGDFELGAAFTSLNSGVPVVPVSLRGSQGLFSEMSWPQRFRGKVEIVLHPPLDPADFDVDGSCSTETLNRFTQTIRDHVASCIDYPVEEAGAKAQF
ncbi:MAG: hypothetical protein A2107_15710 [Verrucomicrobia bacterium GWF2_62_7]|nr:MAG: hypothetical protein A2107_15710 [Verrucomicrobia bacterium GWF2_62_7]